MKLPTKQGGFDPSMSRTMRDPILERMGVESRATTQKFYPTEDPRNIERLAAAQANAALGKIGVYRGLNDLAVATQRVAVIHDTTTLEAKKSEMQEWNAGFVANLSNEDLAAWNGDAGEYAYQNVQARYQEEYADWKGSYLDKKYRITNAALASEFKNFERGQLSRGRIEVDKMARAAQDRIATINAEQQFRRIKTEAELNDWIKTNGYLYSPSDLARYQAFGISNVFTKAVEQRTKFATTQTEIDAISDAIELATLNGPNGEAPKITSERAINLEQDLKRHSDTLVKEYFVRMGRAMTSEEVMQLAQEGQATGLMDSRINDAGENIWNKLATLKASQLRGKEIVDTLVDDEGDAIDSPALYAWTMQTIDDDPLLNDTDRQATVDAVLKMHTNWLNHQINLEFYKDPTGKSAQQLVANLRAPTDESKKLLGVRDGDLKTHRYLTDSLNQLLLQNQAINSNAVEVVTKEQQRMQMGQQILANTGQGPNPTSADWQYASNYAWQGYLIRDQKRQKDLPPHARKGTQDFNYLVDKAIEFTETFRGAPTDVVNQFADIVANGATEQERIAAAAVLHRMHKASNGGLLQQEGLNANASIKMAVAMWDTAQHISNPAARQDFIANFYKSKFENAEDSPLVKAGLAKVTSEGGMEFFTTYAEEQWGKDMGIDEYDDLLKLAYEYLPDSVAYFGGNVELAMDRALAIAFTNVGIENGRAVMGSYYGLAPYANASHDDNNEVLKQNHKDIAAMANMDPEDVQLRVFTGPNGNKQVVAIHNGRILRDAREWPDGTQTAGKPLIFDLKDLSNDARKVLEAVNQEVIATDAQAVDEEMQKQLQGDDQVGVNEWGQRNYDQRVEDAKARELAQSRGVDVEQALIQSQSQSDPVTAAEAERTLEVLNSPAYQNAIRDGDEELAEKIMREQRASARRAAEEKKKAEQKRLDATQEEWEEPFGGSGA